MTPANPDVAEVLTEVEDKLRCIIAHATGGGNADTSRSINDICVEISRHHNRIWEYALAKATTSLPQAEPAGDLVERVARAICTEVEGDPDKLVRFSDFLGGGEMAMWRRYEKAASAVLASLSPVAGLEDTIERILFRRALQKRLEGYTLETSQEIAAAIPTASGEVGQVVAWLRNIRGIRNYNSLADAIERGDHRSTDEMGK